MGLDVSDWNETWLDIRQLETALMPEMQKRTDLAASKGMARVYITRRECVSVLLC